MFFSRDHVVAQIIESEFVIGAIRYIAAISRLPECRLHVMLYHANSKPQKFIDRSHPLPVSTSEVVVDSDNMSTCAGKRVQISGQRRDKRLSLASRHLSDLALVKHNATDELRVEVPHADRATRSLAHSSERLRQYIIDCFPARQTFPEVISLLAQFVVRKLLKLWLKRIYFFYCRRKLLKLSLILCPYYFI